MPSVKIIKNDPLIEKYIDHWHVSKQYTSPSCCPLLVSFMTTGCGLQQICGLSNITSTTLLSYLYLFKEIQADSKIKNPQQSVSGVLIGTLGQGYWATREQLLFKLGFTLLSEYGNTHPTHPITHKQRLYQINLWDVDFDKLISEITTK